MSGKFLNAFSQSKTTFFRRAWPLILLLLGDLILFRAIFQGEVLFFGDNLSLRLPNAIYAAQRIRAGELPLWNPYIFNGIPFLADISTGVFYPLNALFLFLDPFWALTALTMASVWIAGVGMYWLCRSMRLSQTGSTAGAFVFAFSATILHYTTYLNLLSSSIWMPFTLASYMRFDRAGSRRWLLVSGLFLTLQILGGHPQPVFYTILLLVAFSLFYPGKVRLRTRVGFVLPLLVALGFCAVVLLPAFELSRLSTRVRLDFAGATRDSLHPLLLLRLILPNLFDEPRVGMTWGPAWRQVAGNNGYAGIVSLLLLLIALGNYSGWPKSLRRWFTFFLGIGAFSVFISLGKYSSSSLYFIRFFLRFDCYEVRQKHCSLPTLPSRPSRDLQCTCYSNEYRRRCVRRVLFSLRFSVLSVPA